MPDWMQQHHRRYPYSHSPTRPPNYYAALKEPAAMTPAETLLKYATSPEMELRLDPPKPRIKELTEARRTKITQTTGRTPPRSIAARPSGAAPAYKPRYAWPSPAPF